jgi:nucleotide-binding universal stress UspA family protein
MGWHWTCTETKAMSTILCATDFSPCSRTATRLAAALGRRRGEGLLLLYALEPVPLDAVSGFVGEMAGWQQELIASAQTELDREAVEIRRTGIAVETRVVPGSARAVVVEAARAQGISLVVMGTHGRKGAAHLFLGSCAEEVVRGAPCPVLVTREEGVDLERWESANPLRLAVATDGSRASEAVFFWTRTAAPTAASDVSLVRVYWPPQEAARYGIDEPWLGREGHPDLLKLVERDLRHETEALAGAHTLPIRFRVGVRDAGEELGENAPQLGVDALVIGIPKHRLGHWTPIAPSSVLRSATIPVFCIPEGIQPERNHIPRYRSVLIACDLSDVAREAILPAYGLLAGGGRVELCYVHERGRDEGIGKPAVRAAPPLSDDERATVESKLRGQVPPEAAERGIGTRISVIEGQEAAGAILQAAQRLDVDVIALASHGRTGLGRLLLGSVAEEVARNSSRPLLIVHAKPGDGRA